MEDTIVLCVEVPLHLKLPVVPCRTEFEGFSEDETVRVVMSGNQEPRGVEFTDQALENGAEVTYSSTKED